MFSPCSHLYLSERLEEAVRGVAASYHFKPEVFKAVYHFPWFQATWLKFFSLTLSFASDFCLVETEFLCFVWTVVIDVWNTSLLRKIVKAQGLCLFRIRQSKGYSQLFATTMDHLVHFSSSRTVLRTVMMLKGDICILLWLPNIPGISWKDGLRGRKSFRLSPDPQR